jgi:TRAP-type C4-dicarboxylate transport system substrate-binding protein
MKRTVKFLAVLLVLVVTAVPALAVPSTLRVVGSWSSLTLYKNLEKPFWTETVPASYGDEMKTIMTSLGQININGAAVLRQMKLGVFDVVSTVADYVVSDCPELAGLDLPALAPDIATARKVVEAYRPVLAEALEKAFDVKLLAVVPYPAQVLFSRVDLKGLDDLKGKKIRASGWTTSAFLEAAGATGVTISFSEVPQSLQRGVVDAAVTGSLSGFSAGWGEVCNYIYPLPIGGWDYVITVISNKTWGAFSPEEQQKLQALIEEKVEVPGWTVTEQETQDGVDFLVGARKSAEGKSNSLKLIPVADQDLAQSRQLLVDVVLPAWAEMVGTDAVMRWNETIGKVTGLKAR